MVIESQISLYLDAVVRVMVLKPPNLVSNELEPSKLESI